jgi:serine/threonine protein phosphatase PrpC
VALSWLPFGAVRTSASARAAALASATLERVDAPDRSPTFVAGGRQTKGALPVRTACFDAAVYSSRGRGYARYNEDAALLFRDEAGMIYAAVFDQAGGLGGRVRGAGSRIAAERAFVAFKKLATAQEGSVEPARILLDQVELAHQGLIERGEGEVTTAVMVVARPGAALVLNSGDSAAWCFDPEGRPRAVTLPHEDPDDGRGALTHAVGLLPDGHASELYAWTLDVGERLLLCSDGLLDAGLSPEDLGRELCGAESAEEAINQLAGRVLRRMSLMQAKPDNLSLVLVHCRALDADAAGAEPRRGPARDTQVP